MSSKRELCIFELGGFFSNIFDNSSFKKELSSIWLFDVSSKLLSCFKKFLITGRLPNTKVLTILSRFEANVPCELSFSGVFNKFFSSFREKEIIEYKLDNLVLKTSSILSDLDSILDDKKLFKSYMNL